jgi:hypothetical protein
MAMMIVLPIEIDQDDLDAAMDAIWTARHGEVSEDHRAEADALARFWNAIETASRDTAMRDSLDRMPMIDIEDRR